MKSGFILLDKPSGMTSRQAGAKVAKLFGADPRRTGHIGTLDPMASGLLVIALGEATKMIPFMEEVAFGAYKDYEFQIKWGVRTDTDDITGTIVEEGGRIPPIEEIEKAWASMAGKYEQTPPAYSAKKINGTPAHKLARQGIVPDIKPKLVSIYSPSHARATDTYSMGISKGGYVRSVVRDLAAKLGTIATTSMIRRTYMTDAHHGGISLDALEHDINKLESSKNSEYNAGAVSKHLMPLDFGLDDIPVAKLETNDAKLFQNGGFVQTERISTFYPEGWATDYIRVYNGDKFIGIGTIKDGVLKPKRIINVD